MSSTAREWREIPGRYNLKGSKCPECGKVFFPKRSMCPLCRRASIGKMIEYKVERKGAVYTYSVVYDVPEANKRMQPYVVGMIRTDDDILLTAQIVDVDPENVEIGMRVQAVLRKIDEDGPSGVIRYGFKFAPCE